MRKLLLVLFFVLLPVAAFAQSEQEIRSSYDAQIAVLRKQLSEVHARIEAFEKTEPKDPAYYMALAELQEQAVPLALKIKILEQERDQRVQVAREEAARKKAEKQAQINKMKEYQKQREQIEEARRKQEAERRKEEARRKQEERERQLQEEHQANYDRSIRETDAYYAAKREQVAHLSSDATLSNMQGAISSGRVVLSAADVPATSSKEVVNSSGIDKLKHRKDVVETESLRSGEELFAAWTAGEKINDKEFEILDKWVQEQLKNSEYDY